MTKRVMIGSDFVRNVEDVEYFVMPTEESDSLH